MRLSFFSCLDSLYRLVHRFDGGYNATVFYYKIAFHLSYPFFVGGIIKPPPSALICYAYHDS